MSATATAPAAPAAAWLAAPAGPWKKLSKAMTAEVPAIAGRPVPVACAPGAGLGNPACYIPAIPVIEVDGKLLGAAPATCDPASPADRERYPVTWGALIHECAHAAHTSDALPAPGRANWCKAANELEESRIEARQAGRRPGDRRWLRATASRLILDDFTAAGAEPASPREAGLAAALLLAREDAGILEPAETAAVAAKVEAIIGPDALARLRATWREVHHSADGDMKAMTRLARRWCRILGLDPDAAPPAPIEISISDLLDAIRDAIQEIQAAVEADFTPPPPFPAGTLHKREEEKQARSTAGQAARDTFGRTTPPPAVTGTRDPRDDEAAAARRLARALRESTAGGRDKVTTTSKVPPGRLPHGQGPGLPGAARRRRGPHRRALHPHHQPASPRPAAAARHRLRHLRHHERLHRPGRLSRLDPRPRRRPHPLSHHRHRLVRVTRPRPHLARPDPRPRHRLPRERPHREVLPRH